MIKEIKSFLFENKSNKQIVVKNTIWLTLSEGISKGSGFILTILIVRELGTEGFGILSFIISIIGVLGLFIDFSSLQIFLRETVKDKTKIPLFITNILSVKIFYIVLSFLILLCLIFIPKLGEIQLYLFLYLVYTCCHLISDFLRMTYRSLELMEKETKLKLILNVFYVSILGTFIYFSDERLLYILIGFAVYGVLETIFTIYYVSRTFDFLKIQNLSIITSKDIFSSSHYLIISGFFIYLYVASDQIMLGFFNQEEQLGIYSSVYKLINILWLPSAIYISALIPNLLKSLGKSKILKNILFISGYWFCCILVIIFLGKYIINFLYGADFTSGYAVFIILGIGLFFMIVNNFLWQVLTGLKLENKIVYIMLLGGLLNILGNYFLIPVYSIEGTAFTTLIAEFLVFSFMLFYLFKNIKYEAK